MNGSFLIPEKFYLSGRQVKVLINDPYLNKKRYHGLSVFKKSIIYLCNFFDGKPLPKTQKEQTFYHELVHMILDDMSAKDDKLNRLKYDEDFVEGFAQRLYEYEKTKQ